MPSGKHKRALVVDDDPIIRAFLEQVLVEEGYRVGSVGSGDEALAVMQRVTLHLVITDLKMPGTAQGQDVVRAAKAVEPHPPKVIVITGFAEEGTESEIRELGAEGFLEKPFRVDAIKQTVHEVMDAHQAHSTA